MSYPVSSIEIIMEKFPYFKWISNIKEQLILNKQIRLLDELQNNIVKQQQIYDDSSYGHWATGHDESAYHRKKYINVFYVPCFNFLLHTILYIKLSLCFIPIYSTNTNRVRGTSLHCENLLYIYPIIKKLLQLDYSEDISMEEKIIKISQQNIANYYLNNDYMEEKIIEIIKYMHLINLKVVYDSNTYNMCNKLQHQIKKYNCDCYYPRLKHPINTIVCDKMLSTCYRCKRNNSLEYPSKNCEVCGIEGKLHKLDHYCICNIQKMDATTLKLHYIKCMDPTLTVETMTPKYYTKYSMTEALKNNVKIIVPVHEIKQSKPKKSISASLRQKVWNKYIGLSIGETLCKCCNTNIISQLRFHCGHVIAEKCGGETILENLRPICEKCNLSMGTQNLNEFSQTLI
jgi:hypothetical protein